MTSESNLITRTVYSGKLSLKMGNGLETFPQLNFVDRFYIFYNDQCLTERAHCNCDFQP